MRVLADVVQTGLSEWWAPALAFAAGVVSFASPCVISLVPGYLSFVTGTRSAGDSHAIPAGNGRRGERGRRLTSTAVRAVSVGDAGGAVKTKTLPVARTPAAKRDVSDRPLAPILLFILGFAAVFTGLGAFASVLLPVVRSHIGLRISGLVILVFGAVMLMYAFRIGIPGLYAERRPFLGRVKPGKAGAFPLGMAFAAGWTPCIGPVLGGILSIAAAQGGSTRGAVLLFSYSLGLGLPFLAMGLGIRRLMGAFHFIKRNYHWIAGVSGIVMVTIGALLISGLWLQVINPLLRLTNRFTPAL